MENEKYLTNTEEETISLGSDFAKRLKPGDIVAFYGCLGSGKTQFIKGICDFFNVEEIVTSPTFSIINQYFGTVDRADVPIYHIDLYRIKSTAELNEIGFYDCLFSKNAIKLVEWSEKANGTFPKDRFNVTIQTNEKNEDQRNFVIENK